jgi:hypothetical protein
MAFHVFVKEGDAVAEVQELLRGMGARAEEAGLHKALFVTRARQTVVMVTGPEVRLALALRERPGWSEPEAASR